MTIEIDQSGKIENTNRNTVIAFSNHKSKSILISAKDKREIQEIFRGIGKGRMFVYRIFAILIFLLIKNFIHKIDEIIVDEEYPGWNHLIKDFLLREIRRVRPEFETFRVCFKRIGRKSRAHILAYKINTKKRKADVDINVKDVMNYIIK